MLRRAAVGACFLALGCGRTEPWALCPIPWDATTEANLRVTADDRYRLFVDGRLIDAAPRLWHLPQTYVVHPYRHPARPTVIALEGANQWNTDGFDRGVLADLSGPTGPLLLTDHRWRVTSSAAAEWELPGFNDSSWGGATPIGPHGIAPWFSVLGTSSATWVWSYVPAGAAATKQTLETIWLRRTFYLRLDGGVSDTPNVCP